MGDGGRGVIPHQDVKHYYPDDKFELTVSFKEPLPEGEYPIAFLIGPEAHFEDPTKRRLIGTQQTVKPERIGHKGYRLKGTVPKDAIPGRYVLHRVDIFHSMTGTDDAEERDSISEDKLKQFAIIVNPKLVPKVSRSIESIE
jgi:hypothetical protein